MKLFHDKERRSNESEHPVHIAEHTAIREDSAWNEETNTYSEHNENINEVNKLSGEHISYDNVKEEKKEREKNALRNLLKGAFHGGAAALATLVLTATLSGTYSEKLEKVFRPWKDKAVNTQTSNFEDILLIWNKDPDGPHDYGEGVITKQGSCTEEQEITYTCSKCGVQKHEYPETGGHSLGKTVEENRIEPDCTHDGSYDEVQYCELCNKRFEIDHVVLPATGHVEGDPYTEEDSKVAPTCTEDGMYYVVTRCKICGERFVVNQVTLPATGHVDGDPYTEEDSKIDPTCTEGGMYYVVTRCKVCGEETGREQITVEATGHTLDRRYDKLSDATCTSPEYGNIVEFCSACGEEHIVDENYAAQPALGHTYTLYSFEDFDWDNYDYERGDEGPGEHVTVCNRCGKPAVTATYDKNTQVLTATVDEDYVDRLKAEGVTDFRWDIMEYYMDYIVDGYGNTVERIGDSSVYKEYEYTGNTISITISLEATATVSQHWDRGARYGAVAFIAQSTQTIPEYFTVSEPVTILEERS